MTEYVLGTAALGPCPPFCSISLPHRFTRARTNDDPRVPPALPLRRRLTVLWFACAFRSASAFFWDAPAFFSFLHHEVLRLAAPPASCRPHPIGRVDYVFDQPDATPAK